MKCGITVEVFRGLDGVKRRELDLYDALNSQKETLSYKQNHVDFQMKSENYLNNSVKSKIEYIEKRSDYVKKWMDRKLEKIACGENQIQPDSTKKIILFGGFSGSNQGDEAQIDETYRSFVEHYPEYEIKVMSHVKEYTYEHHMHCSVGDNSRLAIWNVDNAGKNFYKCSTEEEKEQFKKIGDMAVKCAKYIVNNVDVPFEYDKRMLDFLIEIKTSQLIVFSGGGYLTGKTLSRLWDHLYVMEIANIFRVPYILTGQTIGLWESEFTKRFAQKEINRALYISLRDSYASPAALEEIGISSDKYDVTHDDALFCRKEEDIHHIMSIMGIEKGKYVVINAHFWGVKSRENITSIIEYIKFIIQYILSSTNYEIVLLPMQNVDVLPLRIINDLSDDERVHMINGMNDASYDFAKIRAIIASAKLCITMKHHPIIFAMGEKIPTIALCYQQYYVHKNRGALGVFDLQKYAVNIEDDSSRERFVELFHVILNDYGTIQNHIELKLAEMKKMKDRMFVIVDGILGEKK